METTPTLDKYYRHLELTVDWISRSIDRGRGGSCGYYLPPMGWSAPYPETTGYLIPTLLSLDPFFPARDLPVQAIRLGEWLLNIQLADGSWPGGFYRSRKSARPSIFNTGQVLKGLIALYENTGESRWLESVGRGARWIIAGIDQDGLWTRKDYRARLTPSYYTEVARPLLQLWKISREDIFRRRAQGVLDAILARRQPDGTFSFWSFDERSPAFTHTIAYTLRGFMASALLLEQWDRYGKPCERALETLWRKAELRNGRLPGVFTQGWKGDYRFSCLTGNVQIALCLLTWEDRERDLRLVNGAAKLVDFVCRKQRLQSSLPGVRGGVAGSDPLWGSYLPLRYPNWAAKYHCDALRVLINRLQRELGDND
ncbi:MAG: hypothetical protein P9M08_00675 [Candidatus Erginobacter occultus]|nr:hypothetical protein [Candidatus Erginobacter occultus]